VVEEDISPHPLKTRSKNIVLNMNPCQDPPRRMYEVAEGKVGAAEANLVHEPIPTIIQLCQTMIMKQLSRQIREEYLQVLIIHPNLNVIEDWGVVPDKSRMKSTYSLIPMDVVNFIYLPRIIITMIQQQTTPHPIVTVHQAQITHNLHLIYK